MRIKGILVSIFIVIVLSALGWFAYQRWINGPFDVLFKTQKLEKHDIYKIVNAEGSLEAQGTLKIGSLISAKVKTIHVKDGDQVKKNQLLADLENDKGGDADVRRTKAMLEKAKADLDFKTAFYKRESALFKSGQISRESFEKTTADYISAKTDVDSAKANYDKELFLFEQSQVRAPVDGTIVGIPTKVGQAFSPYTSPPQVLFEIAQDLSIMKATLAIDENKIGDVKVGMQAKISVDAYPYKKPWKGKIISLGLGKAVPSDSSMQQCVTYEAEVLLTNTDNLLRPGMTVHAKITVEKVKEALSVPGFVFQLNPKVLEAVAKKMKYEFNPIEIAKKRKLIKQQDLHPVKTVWIIQDKTFVEKAVAIGVTDNANYQILSGLTETDDIIADDMTASEEVKKIAKQVAGS